MRNALAQVFTVDQSIKVDKNELDSAMNFVWAWNQEKGIHDNTSR